MKSILGSIWNWVVGCATVASIVGLVLAFVSDKNAVIISLIALCIFLAIIIVGVFITLSRLVKQNHPDPYQRISSFYEFRSDDGQKSVFEMYRLIQCKRALLTHIEYKFKWSGTKLPTISSNSQTLGAIIPSHDENSWDKCDIHFKTPLTYNESTVVHIKTENDDYDGKAQPFLSSKLDSPIMIMQFKVLLSYKPESYTAKAKYERKKIDADVDAKWEYIASVDFDSRYKQYQYVDVDPEPGYIYRIMWEK